MADEDATEPDEVAETSNAEVGSSESTVPGAAAAREAFQPPNYREMNENISETRKEAGPLLEEDGTAEAAPRALDDEDGISETDPT